MLSVEGLVWFCRWEQGGLSRGGQQRQQNRQDEKEKTEWGLYKQCLLLREDEFEQKRVQGCLSRVEPDCGGLSSRAGGDMVNQSSVQVQ